MDYELTAKNIRMVNLGPHNSVPRRLMRLFAARRAILKFRHDIDLFLVRSPTPLLLVFSTLGTYKPIIMYLVGDYLEASRSLQSGTLKTASIRMLSLLVDLAQRKVAKHNLVVTNSKNLYDKYGSIARKVEIVRSTTLSPHDFFYREDTCSQSTIKVLFTGRLDPLKGLFELVEACNQLAEKGQSIELHLAGLLLKGLEDLPKRLSDAANGSMKGKVFYHGKKRVGQDLNALYRMCDVYVVASKGVEGFPRTIWEAFANGLPVVASRIGSIPEFLEDEKDALLVTPGSTDDIEHALWRVISDSNLRQCIIANGYKQAEGNTLEKQGKKMADVLKSYLAEI